MPNNFISVLDKIKQDAIAAGEFVLNDAVKYLPLAESAASLLFPPAVAPLEGANAVADLLQKAVAAAEIQLASAGLKGDVGPQKLEMVLNIVSSAVTSLLGAPAVQQNLGKQGITVNTTYITSLVNAVVSFLNTQGVVSTATPVAATA
jgi:uncharacterized membrane protein